MQQLLDQYKAQKPMIVFEWQDSETDACGWIVINSLRGGAAGGGTRMRKGLNKAEVVALAKIMEVKFSISGPAIGGAKSGINFDPNDPRKKEVLKRWFQAATPLLKNYYGTGGDLNIDEVQEVIPITEDLGLWHPQEGIVKGHFQPKKNKKIHLIGQLRQGVSKIVEDPAFAPKTSKKYSMADLITGFGVAKSIIHYYDIYKQSNIKGKRVIIQGWGNVAGAAGYYLAQSGAKIVGIIDRYHGILQAEGLTFEEIQEAFVTRVGNRLSPDLPNALPFEKVQEKIWSMEAEIFIPAAASKLVSKKQAQSLLANGLESVACGANNPFIDEDLFFGETAKFVDENCSLIPDFIANCGMARLFAYLMQHKAKTSDEAMFNDVSSTIRNALFETYKYNTGRFNLYQNSLDLCLKKLMA